MGREWKWCVPVILNQKEEYFKEYLDKLITMKADMVLLVAPFPEANILSTEEWRAYSNKLKQKVEFFEANGIKAGFWMARTIGHTPAFSSTGRKEKAVFQEITGPAGKSAGGCYCPLDENFKKYLSKAFKIIAESGVKFILLDDDFRIGLHGDEAKLGCFCPLHIEKFSKRAKMNLSRNQLVGKVVCGNPNKIRSQWLKFTGESLVYLAKIIEKAVHSVNKKIRIGQCASPSHWSSEGFEMKDLLKALAGKTRPFVRISGAPYWAKESASSLPHILELNRLEYSWLNKNNTEVVTEGDTFPHTRFYCSAKMLHSYTQFILASGFSGIMEYALPYFPKPGYETAYTATAVKYAENYAAIRRFFPEDDASKGLNVIINQNYNCNITASSDLNKALAEWTQNYIPPVLSGISGLGIPLTYNEAAGPSFLSGASVLALKVGELNNILKNGVLVDAVASEGLLKRGVDIGIKTMKKAVDPVLEKYSGGINGRYAGESIWLLNSGENVYFHCEPKPGAKTISEFQDDNKNALYPGTILYENAKGQRFCILPYDMSKASACRQLIHSYAKQEQLAQCLGWAGRTPLVVSIRQPAAHIMCKAAKSGKRLAIAVHNCHLDPLLNPVLLLRPDIKVGKKIELLLPDAKKSVLTTGFEYQNDGKYGYLKIKCKINTLELLSIGLRQD
ncbi:MAG: hypothetical protein A2231_06575 [Candidatus Firestonebacteria bacterium RIFOXYA2_FULL_40_8]|nr:MAG: hypothetical protein A2231_06575 [Candidatus Firestonebacteria bacterium RIFOXYA2_FULL_40_8]